MRWQIGLHQGAVNIPLQFSLVDNLGFFNRLLNQGDISLATLDENILLNESEKGLGNQPGQKLQVLFWVFGQLG